MTQPVGPSVRVWFEPVDGRSSAITMRYPERCPSCGADWRRPRAATPRHSGGREYRCESCGEHFHAQQVDADGRPVASPGWGLAQERRKGGPTSA